MNDTEIRSVLRNAKTIAVVGASPKPWRDSNSIMQFLQSAGYTVFPVNPKYAEILGRQCFPSVRQIPEKIDIVDIFRRSDAVLPIVEDAVAVHAKTVWMQLGVINEDAAQLARDAGLSVIINKCIAVEYRSLVRSKAGTSSSD
ncbi:MAG TPA: CoA-binding protein [Bacteroidota bacterium]|nr:CoA-binding protein [Bacteroidota bacterium]